MLYDEFCDIYEQIVPFVDFSEHEIVSEDENLEVKEDMSTFILKSAILSTTSKFICEGILSVVNRDNEQKQENKK